MPVSTDLYYRVSTEYDTRELTVVKPVEAQIRENAFDESYTETTLESGERLYFYATDGETWVDFLLDSGSHARIYIDDNRSFPQTIGGVDIGEIFKGVMYEG